MARYEPWNKLTELPTRNENVIVMYTAQFRDHTERLVRMMQKPVFVNGIPSLSDRDASWRYLNDQEQGINPPAD